jgi:hypothetical protein
VADSGTGQFLRPDLACAVRPRAAPALTPSGNEMVQLIVINGCQPPWPFGSPGTKTATVVRTPRGPIFPQMAQAKVSPPPSGS